MESSGLWVAFLIVVGLLVSLFLRCRKLQALIDDTKDQIDKLSGALPYLEQMPLYREGMEIQYRWNSIEEEWGRAKESFHEAEWKEIKAFMESSITTDRPFSPSQGLMRSLESWADKHALYYKMSNRKDEYKQAFADVMAGKLSVKEAEDAVYCGPFFLIEEDLQLKEALIKSCVEKWSEGELGGYYNAIKECYPEQV